jgi:hypothetical protein
MIPSTKPQTTEDGFVDDLKPGTTLLHGQYTIRKYLNAGGFGITYLAADSLDRTVVIKECFPGAFCRRSNLVVQARSRAFQNELGTIVQLFLKEARSLSKLSHPNIVGVHQVFEGNNTAYMALDFIQGEDLFSLISRRDPRLTASAIRAILEKLLDAIGSVHAAGLLHRDISPDNIIITETLEPILIDFGAAREQATRKTRALSALRIVKDGYSPQEFYIAGSEQGPSSDLYSLAATFYHLITGELPPNSQIRIASQVEGKQDPYVPLAKRTSGFDPAFCDALDRAIAVLPRSRFQSAAEWLAAITSKAPQVQAAPTNAVAARPTSMPGIARFPSTPFKPKVGVDEAPAKPRKLRGIPILAGGSAAVALVFGGFLMTGVGTGGNTRTEVPVPRAAAPVEVVQDTGSATGKAEAAKAFQSAMSSVATEPSSNPSQTTAPVTRSTGTQAAELAPARVILAREAVPGVGVVTTGWTIELPFSTASSEDLTLTKASGPAASGLVPGLRVIAVDGQPVSGLSDLTSLMQTARGNSDAAIIRVDLTLQAADGGQVTSQVVEVPVVPYIDFPNGLSFQSRLTAGSWVTEIASVPLAAGGGLQIGDVLVALMPGREPVGHIDGLRDLILRETAAGKTTLSMAIRRNGLMWVAEMTVGAGAG